LNLYSGGKSGAGGEHGTTPGGDAHMTREEIVGRLREAMKESSTAEVEWDTVSESTDIGSLGFDSLSILDLIYEVQQKFGIQFDAEKLVDIRTVGQLVDFLQNKV
jgi:acyl carrier protein